MNRRADILAALGIDTEWVPRQVRAGAPVPPRADKAAPPGLETVGEAGAEGSGALPAADVAAGAMARVAVSSPGGQLAEPSAGSPVTPSPEPSAGIPAIPAEEPPEPLARPEPVPTPVSLLPAMPADAPTGSPDRAPAQEPDDLGDLGDLDWDALQTRVAGCTACGLCETRTRTVFGVGDRRAEWMLIGEAPGENEDRQGEPFVGQAGKLLDNMLASVGLARDRNAFIANVLKCRPPGNRNPEPAEVEQCEPYLRRQIALLRPRLIVVLGRFAAQSLLRTTTPIGKLRGVEHRYEDIPVVVTYHPAYLLRTLTDKARAWEDLCLAREIHEREANRG